MQKKAKKQSTKPNKIVEKPRSNARIYAAALAREVATVIGKVQPSLATKKKTR